MSATVIQIIADVMSILLENPDQCVTDFFLDLFFFMIIKCKYPTM